MSSGIQPKTISFDGQGLKLDTAADAEQICAKLTKADYEVLILGGNTFGIEAAERIGAELSRGSKLREAHFKDLFTGRGREDLPVALGHLLRGVMNSGAKLIHLDLSDNAIGPIGAPPVLEFLKSESAQSIQRLYVNNCGWGPDGSCSLATVLPCLTYLKEFICGRSRLENQGSTAIAKSLLSLSRLRVLEFPQNGINVPGIEMIAKVVLKNKTHLRVLDLSDNTIKPEGAKALANVLSQVEKLEKLSLNDALLGNEGLISICDALANSPSLANLSSLDFEGNEIRGQKVVDFMLATFRQETGNLKINLLENEFSKEQLLRLEANSNFIVDEPDDCDYEESSCSEGSDSGSDTGFALLDKSDSIDFLIEAIQEFIHETNQHVNDQSKISTSFNIMNISKLADDIKMQIYGEEFGLIKTEMTGKKKPFARQALIYIGKHIDEFPETIQTFFRNSINQSSDMDCGKLLFLGKLN